MVRYIVRRSLLGILVLFGVSLLTFFISHVIPGDPAAAAAGLGAPPEQIEMIRKQYGLDRPLPEQYVHYLAGIVRGDLGESIVTKRPVASDLRKYMPATIELTLGGAIFALIFAIPLGIVAGLNHKSLIDHVTRVLSTVAAATPLFWAGFLLQLLFYKGLGLLPATGRLDVGISPPPTVTGFYTIDSLLAKDLDLFRDTLHHLILPSFCLSWQMLAIMSRTLRSTLLEVLNQDFIRVARAKGLRERVVTYRHAIPHTLIPLVTVFGTYVGLLLSGAIVTETIFSWPGVGSYAVRAIVSLDFAAIMGVVTVVSVLFVGLNLIVDFLYPILDPRIRYE